MYKVKWILPAGPATVIVSEQATSYLLGFDKKGICIFPVGGDWHILGCLLFEWKYITDFEVKKGPLLEDTLKLSTNEINVSLKINPSIAENPRIKQNIKAQEEFNYYED